MGYSSRCSICTHKHADTINDLLRRRALGEQGLTYVDIIDKIDRLGGPKITECAISRHVSKHFDVAAEGRRRAGEQYDQAADDVAKKVTTDLEMLDKIRDIGYKMLEDGDLTPDVKDILAAIKVKHQSVMKEENPIAALFDLVAEASRGDD